MFGAKTIEPGGPALAASLRRRVVLRSRLSVAWALALGLGLALGLVAGLG